MGRLDSVTVKCWIAFLESKGCVYKSTEASHTKWKCPNCLRSIIFRAAKKEIPFFHIASNLKSMGVSKEEFSDWLEKNC